MRKFRIWTEPELEILRANYGVISAINIAAMLGGRTKQGIQWKAFDLGLKCRASVRNSFKKNAWSKEQDGLLKHWYGKLPAAELAKKIGKNRQNVYVRASQRGLTDKKAADRKMVKIVSPDAIQRYLKGENVSAVCQEFGICQITLHRAVRASGAKLRGNVRVRKQKKVLSPIEKRIRSSAFMQGISVDEWTGFVTSERKQKHKGLQSSQEWKSWRQQVFRRDRAQCVMCKKFPNEHGKSIDPHHIKPKGKYPELTFDVDNGVTLCRPCHLSIANNEHKFADQFHEYVDKINGYWREKWAA